MSDHLDTNLTHTWERLAMAAQKVADAIQAKSKGLPIRDLIVDADERISKAHLELTQLLSQQSFK